MKKILAILLAMSMLFALGATAFADDEAEPMYYELGDTVEDFTVELCDGTVTSLYEMLETYDVVMINVWATWCGPCKAEFPVMNEAYDMYSDKVGLICLSPFDSNEDVAAFRDENGLTLPMGYDSIGAGGLVLEGYPTTVLIDRFGTYVLYECGSMLSVEEFTSKWDMYIGDDYTESVIYEEHMTPNEAEYPDYQELYEALCTEGGDMAVGYIDDEYVWPFVVSDGGIINSNVGVENSEADVTITFNANEGDVFAIDYLIDIATANDIITINVDGEDDKYLTGTSAGTYFYEIEDSGIHSMLISFVKTYLDENYTDCVFLFDARVLTGDDAAAVLADLPEYPAPLGSGEIEIDVLNENAKQIVFDDPNGAFAETYGDMLFYLVPEEYASFRAVLGYGADPDAYIVGGDFDYYYVVASQCEYDEEGFFFDAALSGVELGGYENTYVTVQNYVTGEYYMIIVFNNEENVNYFVEYTATDFNYEPIEGLTWQYADGTQPSTDEIAEYDNTAYTIAVVDENGDPIEGVMINICNDEACTPTVVEDGYYVFEGEGEYTIHILKVPEGYVLDSEAEYIIAAGDILEIEIAAA